MLLAMHHRVRFLAIAAVVAAVLTGGAPVVAQSPSASMVASVTHPTGATDVVLRMDTGGGNVPLTYDLTQAPEFTLYGDGSVIFRPSGDPEGDGLPPFVQAAMTASQMDVLLSEALGTGGLRDARESYQHRQMTDQPTTTFRIDADGVRKSVEVDALGTTLPDGDDHAAYRGFQALGIRLSGFGQDVGEGHAQDPHLYQPMEYRAFLSLATDPTVEAIAWPWLDLTLDDFQPYADDDGVLVGWLTPAQVALVTTVPSGGVLSIAIQTAEGSPVILSLRPMLPDEPVGTAGGYAYGVA